MDKNFDLSFLLHSLGDYTEDAILITEAEPIDLPGPRIVWCNKAFTKMTGYTLDDVVGKSPRILQGPKPDRRELDRLRAALERWDICRVELENFKKDGTSFWVEFIVKPVADSTGWFRYWISVQRDMTARREQDEQFATTRNMLAEAPIGLGLLNAELDLTYSNHQWHTLLHSSEPDLTPIPLRANLAAAFARTFKLESDTAASKAQVVIDGLISSPYRTEVSIGEQSYLFRRIKLDDGTSLIIVDDVTEQNKLRAELEFTMKMESMGQLAGGVAHDFNNLLSITLGNLEAALEESESHVKNDFISDAIATVISSRDVIRQLLAFARKGPASRTEVNLPQFLHEFRKLAIVACPDNVDIHVICEAQNAAVFIDRTQLENALLNLVINAKDAMDGGGKLIIAARMLPDVAQAKGSPSVLIEVADNGCGIAHEDLQRVIEPFFSTKESGYGTGLGLAMVHGFARQSGGHLHLESELGVGTRAQLILPAKLICDEITQEHSGVKHELPSRIKVLIVDDDPGIRRILRLYLRDLDWTIEEAGSGVAAAQLLNEGADYDLMITDLSMPGEVQGDDLVSLATSSPNPPRCIILTGNPDYGKSSEHAYRYVLKPVRKQEFLTAIVQAFE